MPQSCFFPLFKSRGKCAAARNIFLQPVTPDVLGNKTETKGHHFSVSISHFYTVKKSWENFQGNCLHNTLKNKGSEGLRVYPESFASLLKKGFVKD